MTIGSLARRQARGRDRPAHVRPGALQPAETGVHRGQLDGGVLRLLGVLPLPNRSDYPLADRS
eukprot:7870098-Pyramimonas_sp.AAC.1